MHLLWYTWNWSTQPQVYINCNDLYIVPPLVWLHSVYLMLHDITAYDEISHAFSHHICRCTVAVFEVCIQVQAGRFYHMHERQQCLPRKRRGMENPCTFLMGKISHAILKVITRWWKIKTNGMHSFLFQMKLCPQKCLIFADKSLWKFLLSTKLLPPSIGLLETHMNN